MTTGQLINLIELSGWTYEQINKALDYHPYWLERRLKGEIDNKLQHSILTIIAERRPIVIAEQSPLIKRLRKLVKDFGHSEVEQALKIIK